MKVKNISPRDEVVVVKEGKLGRVVHTVKPGEILELPNDVGLNLCKAGGSRFVPEGKDAIQSLKETEPKVESVRVARKRAGTEARAEKDIKKGQEVRGDDS